MVMDTRITDDVGSMVAVAGMVMVVVVMVVVGGCGKFQFCRCPRGARVERHKPLSIPLFVSVLQFELETRATFLRLHVAAPDAVRLRFGTVQASRQAAPFALDKIFFVAPSDFRTSIETTGTVRDLLLRNAVCLAGAIRHCVAVKAHRQGHAFGTRLSAAGGA